MPVGYQIKEVQQAVQNVHLGFRREAKSREKHLGVYQLEITDIEKKELREPV